MSYPWMPLYVGDYIGDTMHLSTLEHGAYLLLIMHYWQRGSLPLEDRSLASIAKLPLEQWLEMRSSIAPFFHADWTHERIAEELEHARVRYDKRSEAGRKGGKASAAVKQSSTNATSIATSIAAPNGPAEGVALPKQPQPHLGSSSEALELTPRARVFQKLGSPEGFYEEGEFNNLTLRFPGVDLENRLSSYWPWGVRQGFKPHEIKAALFSTLEKEAGSTKLVGEKATKPEVRISPQLAASKLARAKSITDLEAENPISASLRRPLERKTG